MNKMTVTRALAELKRFDDRIQRELNQVFVSVVAGKGALQKMHMGSGDVAQNTKLIQSAYDTVHALIAQRQKIKSAVVVSNAVTQVTLGGATMTVAEAIELKKSVEYKRQFLNILTSQVNTSQHMVNSGNKKLEDAIDTMATQVMGSTDKSKIDPLAYEAIAVPQRNAKELSLLDPKNIKEQIKTLTDEISLIETELDYTLSTVNATTVIEV